MTDTNGTGALTLVRPERDMAEWDSDEKLRLLRQTYAKDLNQGEFDLYVEHCRQTGLNPLTKQCQPIKFDGKTLSFYTTIHGLVATAQKTKQYAGADLVAFDCKPKGEELKAQHPNTATATVYRIVQGVRCAFTAEVYWVERNRGNYTWKGQPWTMLGKCALAAAFRLGFAEEMRGMYVEEELPGPVVDAAPAKVSSTPLAAGEDSTLPHLPEGKTWKSWCEELAKRTSLFDTLKDYLEAFQSVTSTNPRQKEIAVATWQVWAKYLLEQIAAMEEIADSEGTASVEVEAADAS